jgi:hypothetical protein
VSLGEVLAIALSAVAAYYAWKSYSRRPKLRFYLQDDPNIVYWSGDKEDNKAHVYCWLANEGAVAAHNVNGWLQYGGESGGVWPIADEHTGVTEVADNTATVYLERLAPNPTHDSDTPFIDSPKLFGFPVEVFEAKPLDLKYRFVCDEGAVTAGTLRLEFTD